MAKNQNLHDAMAAKNDEFYTRREDIDNELRHYKHYFKDKIVLVTIRTKVIFLNILLQTLII